MLDKNKAVELLYCGLFFEILRIRKIIPKYGFIKNALSHPTSDKNNSHLKVFIFRKLKKAGQPFTN